MNVRAAAQAIPLDRAEADALAHASHGDPFGLLGPHDTPMGPVDDLHALAVSLWAIPGVVEHGLFLDCARAVVLGRPDGTTEILGQRP